MSSLTLEGDTLGQKHKNFNDLVQSAVHNKHFNLTNIDSDDSDVHNLLKIDTANKTKNVDYIIKVLKCNDMLYVSRAIKHSTWLITEQEYAHIINPEYLDTQLFPHMLTKAITKLLLHIRLHLRDEKRAEAFYLYFKEESKQSQKFLLNCSIPFIENAIQKERQISLQLFKRLCERSSIFLQYYKKVEGRNYLLALKTVLFVINSDTETFLNVVDTCKEHCVPPFGKKYTEIIMKKFPNKILDNFQKYMNVADPSMVAKYLKKDDIKDFLYKNVTNRSTRCFFANYENVKHFIKNMPREDRFDFVKKTYIDRKEASNDKSDDLPPTTLKLYLWYKYAPFDVALTDLKRMIRGQSSPSERCAIMLILLRCTRKNVQHTKTLLQYYYDKHRNEPFKFKIQFVNKLCTDMATHEFDSDTWNTLNKLFHSLTVYVESDNDLQTCLKSIIVYKVLHNENIPDIVEKKVEIDTFKNFQSKLNKEQGNKIFSYLLTLISTRIQNITITNESDLDNAIVLCKNSINLLIDWDKDVKKYLFLREKVQELIKIKKDNAWKIKLSSLYNTNKIWCRFVFEESMMLCPSENVCLNALKHDPQLLTRYTDEVNALRTDETISLNRLLAKLRVYWQHSLAQQWTGAYLNNMNNRTGHKTVINGLLVLLPQKQLVDIAKKYVPKDSKIDWSEIDETELSLGKNLAKTFYLARPLISLDVVLWYAKGDYLQYAVPSLTAILHNISKVESREHVKKLLEAPVSLQKYGLQLAFLKMNHEELKPIFSDIWKTTKNLTIRTCLFNCTYNLLCKVKETAAAKNLFEILSMFIDNLGIDENKTIFKKLGNPKNIHIDVQGDFFMKSHSFLTSLPASADCDTYINDLHAYAINAIDLLDPSFVADKLLAPIDVKMTKHRSEYIPILSSYVLHGKTEEEQCERFRRVMVPTLECFITSWNLIEKRMNVVKFNFNSLIGSLIWGMRKFLTVRKIIVPVKLFSEIKMFMDHKMSTEEFYVMHTCWKLITEYVQLLAEHKDILNDASLDNISVSVCENFWMPDVADNVWGILHTKISPQLGPIIVQYLKEDVDKYFPTICWLFQDALERMFSYLSFQKISMKMETLKYMVLDEDFVPSYVVVCQGCPKFGDNEEINKRAELRRILSTHPSQEVRMHYQKAFSRVADPM